LAVIEQHKYAAVFRIVTHASFVILSEAKNLSASTEIEEGFFASLRMTFFFLFEQCPSNPI